MKEIKIYVAGKLNSDSPGYIQNCHNMIKQADEIEKIKGWGTQNEIEIAESLRIPVFHDKEKLKEHFGNEKTN